MEQDIRYILECYYSGGINCYTPCTITANARRRALSAPKKSTFSPEGEHFQPRRSVPSASKSLSFAIEEAHLLH